MKSAYVPVAELPCVQELIANFETIKTEVDHLMALYGTNPKFRKVVEGGRNLAHKGEYSYHGQIVNVGLMLDPIVLDARERVLSFGENDVNKDAKMRLIASRLNQTTWIKEWVNKYLAQLCHVSLFVMHPGSEIIPHYGVSDAFVRVHLGIQCPPAAKFYTEIDEPRCWEVGKAFGFLDYEVRHWVKYPGEDNSVYAPRIVLCADVRREAYEQVYPGLLASREGVTNVGR